MKPLLSHQLLLIMLLSLFTVNSSAVLSSGRSGLPDFDHRAGGATAAAVKARRATAAELQSQVPGVQVDFDEVAGSPKWIRSPEGYLSGPGGQGKGISAAVAAGFAANDPHRAVKAFITEHQALFGHGPDTLTAARIYREYVTPQNGMQTTLWQQELDGIEVCGGVFAAHTTKAGELIGIASQFIADPATAAATGSQPLISAEQAVVNAAVSLEEPVGLADVEPAGADPTDQDQRRQFTAGPFNQTIQTRLVWLPMNPSLMRLCWEVTMTSRARGETFQLLVDAETGEVQVRRCLTVYLSEATYRVYTSDSPSPFSPGWSTPSSVQPSLTSRVLVTWSALDTNASPNGWIDDGVNETRGNNVDAHTDINADDSPDLPRPQGSPFRVFDCPMGLAQSPATYTNAAVVQLFYWCNFMHDKLYELGFTEAAGNFQNNNFGRGGLGNDAVQADAQDGSGYNNANFTPTSDGSPPRIQMYLFSGATPYRDGDFDADVVLHEYTHGLSERLVGGGVGISSLQTRGMGEGWSDWYALSVLSEAGDDVNGCYAAGGYVTYLLSGMTQNYYFGTRRYPYSTDLTKNPLTFKDIDPTQASSHAGIPRSPITGTTANEVHNMGEVWCVTLWEARANLIAKYGWAVGNQKMMQLATDGMKLGPANPNFLQARDAILLADQVDNGGANRVELWTAFTKRGMGFTASSPSSSTATGVHESYDLPDDLRQPLFMVLPASVAENAGVLTNGGSLLLAASLPTNVVVSLVSSVPSRLTVPPIVTIPAGQLSSSFDMNVIDNSIQDGNQTVTITATAPGFTNIASSTIVVDDDAPPVIGAQPISQAVTLGNSVTFSVTATGHAPLGYFWRRNGVPIPGANASSYTTNNVQLSDSGSQFSCLVSNSFGTILSSNAALLVTNVPTPVFLTGDYLYLPININGVFIAANTGGKFNSAGTGGAAGIDFWYPGTPIYNYVIGVGGISYPNGSFQTIAVSDLSSGSLKRALIDATVITGLHFTRDISFAANSKAIQIVDTLQNNGASTLSNVVMLDSTDPDQDSFVSYYATLNDVVSVNLPNDLVVATGPSTGLSLGFGSESGAQIPSAIGFGSTDAYGYLTVVDPNGVSADITINLAQNYGSLSPGQSKSVVWYMVFDISKAAVTNAFAALGMTTNPPSILSQPANQSIVVGGTATFSITASGAPPLSYQWNFNGTNLSGATNATLNMANVQFSQAGNYAVLVTNFYGSILSSNAVLTVNLPPPCTPSPSGLVGWWPGEGNANDVVGGNNGTVTEGTVTYAAAEVGQGFNFDGGSNRIVVPDAPALNFGSNQDLTIEAWISPLPPPPSLTTGVMSLVDKRYTPNSSICQGYEFGLVNGSLFFHMSDSIASGGVDWFSSGPDLRDGNLHHVAVTVVRNSTVGGHLYIDGAQVLEFDPTFAPGDLTTTQPFRIGNHAGSYYSYFKGRIDEVSLYSRALSLSEIQAIYNAGSGGKCAIPTPPAIVTQPSNQTVDMGGTAAFSVAATGTLPLSYQWLFNGANIGGATNAALTLINVQSSQAGNYAVLLTNFYGSILSSNAVLTVLVPGMPDSFDPGANSGVYGMAVQADGKVLVGGNFTTLGGQSRPHIVRLNADGKLDTNFNPGANESIISLAVQPDGKILVGGGFTNLVGQSRSFIGLLNTDGTLDTGFNPGANSGVNTLAVQPDGKILVGGQFTALAGQSRSYLGRLNADGTLDTSFNPGANGPVDSLAVQPDGKILVGGEFTTLAGQNRSYIGRLNADGTLDTAFAPGASGIGVYSLAVQTDGKILVGGWFYTLGGQSRSCIGRLNADGTLDTSFNPGANSYLYSLTLQADGRILVGGAFTTLGGQSISCIGRINADGTLDTSFNPGANVTVYSLAEQADGKILVGGWFTNLGGLNRSYIGRLTATTPATQNLNFDGSTITWQRGGSSPEVSRTVFDGSTNGTNWVSLGAGTRIAGGWQLTGLAPTNASLRARGFTTGGYFNGSSWFVETIINPPTITSQPSDQRIIEGGTATFSVTASGALPLSYQWNFNGTNLVGATNAILTLTNVQPSQTGNYTVLVTNMFGSILSSNAMLTVGISPTIATQPAGLTVPVNGTATFSITAGGTEPLAYFWRRNGTFIAGANGASYSLTNAQLSDSGSKFSCLVTNDAGSALSSNAVLKVILTAVANDLCSGAIPVPSAPFDVAYTNIQSTVNATSMGDPVPECVTDFGNGVWYQFTAPNSGLMTVDTLGSDFDTGLAVYTGACGSLVEMDCNDDADGITSEITMPVIGGTTYYILAGGYSAHVGNLVLHLAYTTPPVIVTQPVSQAVVQSNNATFTVVAGGSLPLSYQWYDNGVALADDLRITGSATGSLTISNVATSDTGTYTVAVSNLLGSAVSTGAVLTVLVPAAITLQPSGRSVVLGQPVTFTAGASGTPLKYQWQLNDANIPGATNTTYFLNAARTNDFGMYHLVVSNAAGTVVSADALLTWGQIAAWGRNDYGQTVVPPGLSNVVMVAGGGAGGTAGHTLALRADGTVIAWGSSGAQTNVPTAATNMVAIAAGGLHSLALRANGTVMGWGSTPGAFVPAGLSNVIAIAAGSQHSLALRADGKVFAWGYNGSGQTSVPTIPIEVVAIGAGANHSLAVCSDGTVAAWGMGYDGQINVPFNATNMVAVAGGLQNSLALRANGTVLNWGTNKISLTNAIAGLKNATGIGAGDSYYVALRADGTVLAWGSNDFGQTNVPTYVNNAVAVAGGASHALALISDGRPIITRQPVGGTSWVGRNFTLLATVTGTAPLACQWQVNGADIPGATNVTLVLSNLVLSNAGNYRLVVTNALGTAACIPVPLTVLGNSTLSFGNVPIAQTNYQANKIQLGASVLGSGPLRYQWFFSNTNMNFTTVAGATNNTLMLDPALAVQSGNYYIAVSNLIGGITSPPANILVQFARAWGFQSVSNPPVNVANAIAIAAGGYNNYYGHYFALGADGKLTSWANYTVYYGETNVSALSNSFVTAIAAGYETSLALRSDGTVYAWGYGAYGQTNPPAGLNNVVAIACGDYHDLALKSDGTIIAWGQNNYGEATNSLAATNAAVAIAAGTYHNLGLRADGTVFGWGYKNYGQLTIPAAATNVIAIAAGQYHSLALRANGTAIGWGNNSYGQTTIPAGLSNVVAISASGSHSTLLRADGTVVALGYEYTGYASNMVPADLFNVCAIASGGDHDFGLLGTRAPAFTIQPLSRAIFKGATNVVLAAKVVGVQPVAYQWRFNGTDIGGATNDMLTLTNLQFVQAGAYQLIASNAYGVVLSKPAKLVVTIPLGEALDATNRAWTSSGNALWYGQTNVTHDGVDAARSGDIGNSQETILQTILVTNWPGHCAFWWKVSSEDYFDVLEFRLNGVTQTAISGEVDWQPCSIAIPAGTNTLQWRYSKDASYSSGLDAGWVDQFTFLPDPPVITLQPVGQTVNMGTNVQFRVIATGATPLTYRWQQNSISPVGGNSSLLTLAGVGRSRNGAYSVVVTNAGGSVTSDSAMLKVLVPQKLGVPVLLPDGTMQLLSGDADGGLLSESDLSNFEALASTNLTDWVTLPGALGLTNGQLWLQDGATTNWPQRFYRIIENP